MIALAGLIISVVSVMAVFLVIGIRMPARHELEVSEEFPYPLDAIYHAVANVQAYPQWRTGIVDVEIEGLINTNDGPRLQFKELGGRRVVSYLVVDDTPPSRANGRLQLGRRVHRIVGGTLPYRGQWIFGFEPKANSTVLYIIEQAEVPNPIVRAIGRLFLPPTRNMHQFLIDLRNHLRLGILETPTSFEMTTRKPTPAEVLN